jgi:hypothetical protein
MAGANLPFIPSQEQSNDEFDEEMFVFMFVIEAGEEDEDEHTNMPQRNLPLQGAMYIRYMLDTRQSPRAVFSNVPYGATRV